MRVCPGCRRKYSDSINYCPQEGFPLIECSQTFASLNEEFDQPLPEDTNDAFLTKGMLIGEYEVDEIIAEGGMGVIYSGIHPVIRKRVAIKVISKQFAQDPKVISRFVLEARSVNEIGHHNIVDIFSIGELDDRRNYLIMELLDGLSIQQILFNEGRLSPGTILPIYEQLCDALDAAHSKGFVHRDLKPDNILVLRRPPYPFIKILDFGLAKLRAGPTEHQTQVGTIMGTPEYMSPEQCRGDQVDERTDIYAIGVMLYELVTGQIPFNALSPFKILIMQQNDPLPPPSQHVQLPNALEAVIIKALQKDPADRYVTAGELLADFRRAVPMPMPWNISLEGPDCIHTEAEPQIPTKYVEKEEITRLDGRVPNMDDFRSVELASSKVVTSEMLSTSSPVGERKVADTEEIEPAVLFPTTEFYVNEVGSGNGHNSVVTEEATIPSAADEIATNKLPAYDPPSCEIEAIADQEILRNYLHNDDPPSDAYAPNPTPSSAFNPRSTFDPPPSDTSSLGLPNNALDHSSQSGAPEIQNELSDINLEHPPHQREIDPASHKKIEEELNNDEFDLAKTQPISSSIVNKAIKGTLLPKAQNKNSEYKANLTTKRTKTIHSRRRKKNLSNSIVFWIFLALIATLVGVSITLLLLI